MKREVVKLLVAIGTMNPAKINAIEKVVTSYFKEVVFTECKVPSEVSEQPYSTEETRQGAINRALNTLKVANGDMNFGLEGGVCEIEGIMYCCNWGALALKDGTILTAAGAQFPLPASIAKELRSGKELGPVMDCYTKQKDIRSSSGAVGIFTGGLIDRAEMFEHIVKLLIGQYLFMKNKL